MREYYLAVDIGASGGRHILGFMQDGKIQLEEIYRFENRLEKRNGHLCWDLPRIFTEILNGLREARNRNRIPSSMGIDTWGVDFVLLDEKNRILGDTIGYRDHRTDGMDRLVEEIIPFPELYAGTGIQKQIFNTIYQLMAVKEYHPEYLDRACDFLMIPDYFHFLLTGRKGNEYTNATTTGLVDALKKDWDRELITRLGFKKDIFKPLSKPGTSVGSFKEEIEKETGFSCEVILPATHDTGSAVLSVPAGGKDDFLYISSGTWSLMGIERKEPDCTTTSMEHNFTNEGGYAFRFRYLKNIMGLWMVQEVRREAGYRYTFSEMCEMARASGDFPSRVDVNSSRFLSPENMSEEIRKYCRETRQAEPASAGELAACIYQSLADSYAETAKEIEMITGRNYDRIHILGGGTNAGYLNELTAVKSGKKVFTGPVEATAIGNITAQMLAAGKFTSLTEVRECIFRSFEIKQVQS